MRVESPSKLVLGLGTGVVFGTLLQKARVGRHDVIVDQLLLRDFTVAKVMATANVVGAAGVYALVQRGRASLEIKPLRPLALVAGGVLFGSGLALLGYCPGTSLVAVGAGHRDAIAGVAGMLAGAALFVRLFPRIKPALEAGDRGKVTLPAATKTSPWPWIGGMAAAVLSAAVAGHLLRR